MSTGIFLCRLNFTSRKLASRTNGIPAEAAGAEDLATDDAVELLEMLTRLVAAERISAEDALKLNIFKGVQG